MGALSLVALGVATAEPERQSVFERIDAAEVRESTHRVRVDRLAERLERTDAELDRLAFRQDTVQRASRPVRRRLGTIVSRWEKSLRQTERAQNWGPGRARDTHQLLAFAARKALPAQMNDVGVLDKLRDDRAAYDDLLGQRLRLSVELAQDAATADAAAAERTAELDAARTDPNVKQDLEATASELHTSMSRMLKNPSTQDFHRQKGTLLPPVSSAPKYTYGPRPTVTAAATVRHTGYTWATDSGTPVRAAAAGLVVYAQSFEGYGKLVMVDHGVGYHTLYAHLSELSVSQGDTVSRGGAIGKSGDTGSLDGPKLYFELRKDGRPIDPGPWFIQTK
jgi:murein DD-endopeptidase MepM/ murein hydrolase activator NlpD